MIAEMDTQIIPLPKSNDKLQGHLKCIKKFKNENFSYDHGYLEIASQHLEYDPEQERLDNF